MGVPRVTQGHQQCHHLITFNINYSWCGYMSAYGPVDVIIIPKPHHLLLHLNPDWLYLSGTTLPRLS